MEFAPHASLMGSHRLNNETDVEMLDRVASPPPPSSVNVFPYRDPDFVLSSGTTTSGVNETLSEGRLYHSDQEASSVARYPFSQYSDNLAAKLSHGSRGGRANFQNDTRPLPVDGLLLGANRKEHTLSPVLDKKPQGRLQSQQAAIGQSQITQEMSKSDCWDQATTVTGTSGGTSSLENGFNGNNPDPAAFYYGGGFNAYHRQGKPNQGSKNQDKHGGGAEEFYIDTNLSADDDRVPLLDRCFPSFVSSVAVVVTLSTPVLFALLPSFLWSHRVTCDELCTSIYLTMSCKVFVLAVGCWALHLRRPRANLPCNSIVRTFILLMLGLILVAFWCFYAIRLASPTESVKYESALNLSSTVTDTLLFFHYLSLMMLEVCHLRTHFIIKVVRNTDGESKFYSVGRLSIQNCAVWILQNYYRDFPIYNPYLIKVPSKKCESAQPSTGTKYQVYDIDGSGVASSNIPAVGANGSLISNSRAIMAASARRRESSRNERFYEEQEYEVKVAKRRARLIVAVEEAFYHVRRTDNNDSRSMLTLSSRDAAVAIWPSMARALLKYLRVTRQTHLYRQADLLEHLQTCITLNFTPRAFLEKFLKPEPVVTDHGMSNSWELISNFVPNRPLQEGMVFQLKQEAWSLIVYVARVPIFNISERAYDSKNDRFYLSFNQNGHNTSV